MHSMLDQPLLYDHYEVERVLGSGAMGMVYLARDVRLGRRVALKTLHSRRLLGDDPNSEVAFERFRREAQLCSALIHPNIVTLYEAGSEGQRFTYLAMEYIQGESLLTLLRRIPRLELSAALKITYDVLQGLDYAHSHGITHRDIKPANVLLSIAGQAKISDFGIATSSQLQVSSLTDKGQLLGTPHYMSPEQIAGREVDSRSDLFSVGVMLYEMLSGHRPFSGIGLTDVLYDVVNRVEAPLTAVDPTIPEWCSEFVSRLLRKDPEERFESARDAIAQLRGMLIGNNLSQSDDALPVRLSFVQDRSPDETPTTPMQIEIRPPAPLPRRLSHSSVALLVLIAIVVGGASVLALRSRLDSSPRAIITPEQVSEFQKKEIELREANLLLRVGQYAESQRRFNDYLERYPNSIAAREGRDRAAEALRNREEAWHNSKVEVSSSRGERSTARKTRRETPGLWNRIKSWFSGKRR